ncbi:uncharacterized protein CDAR_253381 [Caerostris darwini]|uniref:Uncharacterized protein n=1 Tax=Caerostris darwini TaxID=1538125 RepID=A0AAV4U8M0_9ARAC|nr:uncharacterized protein CDAR_253381 [Caerostris darwini]
MFTLRKHYLSTSGEPESSNLLIDLSTEDSILDESLLPTDAALEEFLKEGVDSIKNSQLTDEELSWLQEGALREPDEEEQAATKIQAAFRGYMVRKDTSK